MRENTAWNGNHLLETVSKYMTQLFVIKCDPLRDVHYSVDIEFHVIHSSKSNLDAEQLSLKRGQNHEQTRRCEIPPSDSLQQSYGDDISSWWFLPHDIDWSNEYEDSKHTTLTSYDISYSTSHYSLVCTTTTTTYSVSSLRLAFRNTYVGWIILLGASCITFRRQHSTVSTVAHHSRYVVLFSVCWQIVMDSIKECAGSSVESASISKTN